MKNANAAVTALLNAFPPSYYTCDLYAFTSVYGPTVYLATGDFDAIGPAPSAFASATISGFSTVYSCGSINSGFPKIDLKQSKVQGHWARGLDSDQWQVAVIPTTQDPWTGVFTYPDVVGGTPWLAAVRAGLFDGASVQVARAYYASPPTAPYSVASRTCVGTVLVFSGIVGTVDCNQTLSVFTINDYKYLLNQSMPRNLVQSSCRHTLFDTRCTLSAAAYAKTATALAGSSRAVVIATPAVPGGSGTYLLGRMACTAGANANFSRVITAWDGVSRFQPQYPFPFAVSAGDAFTMWPGCDKSLGGGGCGGFANTLNYNGNPFVPVPEISLG